MPDLPTAVPLSAGLPRVLAEDDYAGRFTGALDTVLAAAVGSVDNLTAYLDPATAPADFLAWLGHWVAVPPDEMGDDERTAALRALVPVAADLGARRGTATALADELGRLCGVDVAVRDPGGVELVGLRRSGCGHLRRERPRGRRGRRARRLRPGARAPARAPLDPRPPRRPGHLRRPRPPARRTARSVDQEET